MKGVFVDIETNGLDPTQHCVLEIAVIIYDLHKHVCIEEYSSFVKCSSREYAFASDPEALSINGITLDNIVEAPSQETIEEDLAAIFLQNDISKENSLIICQNPSVDRVFFSQIMSQESQNDLSLPYHWLDLASMFWIKCQQDVKKINGYAHEFKCPVSKDRIAEYFGLDPEPTPHRALNGVKHLINCYNHVAAM